MKYCNEVFTHDDGHKVVCEHLGVSEHSHDNLTALYMRRVPTNFSVSEFSDGSKTLLEGEIVMDNYFFDEEMEWSNPQLKAMVLKLIDEIYSLQDKVNTLETELGDHDHQNLAFEDDVTRLEDKVDDLVTELNDHEHEVTLR